MFQILYFFEMIDTNLNKLKKLYILLKSVEKSQFSHFKQFVTIYSKKNNFCAFITKL